MLSNNNLSSDDDETYGDGSASRGGEVEADAENGSAASVNGDATNVDVEDVVVANDGSAAASQGGQVDTVASGDGSVAASRGGEVNIGNTTNSNNENGSIIADQEMTAIITNNGEFAEIVDDAQGYNSGSNSVDSNAFAAFAGILNQSWNTGVNANTQSGTNIAAGATINFGDAAGSGSCPGNSCH